MNTPLISVIVPIYKVEAYLPECIDSILRQTYTNLECILVDDGSPDRCGVICDEFARRDSRVRVIHQPNRGVSEARNAGLDAAKGQYISFVDSDDWVLPEMLERQIWLFQNYQIQIAEVTRQDMKEQGTGRVYLSSGTEMMLDIFQEKDFGFEGLSCWSPWGKLYKAELWKNIRFPAGRIYEDLQSVCLVYFNAEQVAVLDEPLYFYRVRPKSIMHSALSADLVEMCQWLVDYCEKNDIAPEIVFRFSIIHLYFYFCKEKRQGAEANEPFFQALRGFLWKYYLRMLKQPNIDMIIKLRLSELVLFNSIHLPMRKAKEK